MDLGAFVPVFVAVLVLIGIGAAAMAIGAMFRRPCLRGSCGGPAITGPDGEKLSCDACPNRKRDRAAT
jgi:hypothetical protein